MLLPQKCLPCGAVFVTQSFTTRMRSLNNCRVLKPVNADVVGKFFRSKRAVYLLQK